MPYLLSSVVDGKQVFQSGFHRLCFDCWLEPISVILLVHFVAFVIYVYEKCSQMHTNNIGDKNKSLKRLKRLIKHKETDNSKLDENLEDLSLSVAERRNVSQANGNIYTFSSFSMN